MNDIVTPKFEAWKARLTIDPSILGGEVVFPGSRLSVKRIGDSLARGETVEILREDYPYLTDEDLNFALIYIKAKLVGSAVETAASDAKPAFAG
jgi:uncharacterized protein (DUF433 family)